MTSSPVLSAKRTKHAGREAKHPRREATISPLRRLSRNVLLVGTVLAVLAAFGPTWAVRVGVVVAVIAGVVASLVAWREVLEAHRSASAQLLVASRSHGVALAEERRLNAAVLDTLTGRLIRSAGELIRLGDRVTALDTTVDKLTATIAALHSELQRVSAQHAQARAEIRRDHEVIDTLQQTVRSREAELEALSEHAGSVRSIPRRVLVAEPDDANGQGAAAKPAPGNAATTVDELWSDARRPGVADLVRVSVVLPNYEGDRERA